MKSFYSDHEGNNKEYVPNFKFPKKQAPPSKRLLEYEQFMEQRNEKLKTLKQVIEDGALRKEVLTKIED